MKKHKHFQTYYVLNMKNKLWSDGYIDLVDKPLEYVCGEFLITQLKTKLFNVLEEQFSRNIKRKIKCDI